MMGIAATLGNLSNEIIVKHSVRMPQTLWARHTACRANGRVAARFIAMMCVAAFSEILIYVAQWHVCLGPCPQGTAANDGGGKEQSVFLQNMILYIYTSTTCLVMWVVEACVLDISKDIFHGWDYRTACVVIFQIMSGQFISFVLKFQVWILTESSLAQFPCCSASGTSACHVHGKRMHACCYQCSFWPGPIWSRVVFTNHRSSPYLHISPVPTFTYAT